MVKLFPPVDWKLGIQNMEYYFTKHHQPHHHIEISAAYLYMANAIIKIYHKNVQKLTNTVLASIHTVVVTPINLFAIIQNPTFLQDCANVVPTYGHTHTKTVI